MHKPFKGISPIVHSLHPDMLEAIADKVMECQIAILVALDRNMKPRRDNYIARDSDDTCNYDSISI